ncbi:hypothetical protein ERJ75_001056200 [Trypanosoma vivax]|uniref:Uncharacterized protein n=1 Tax=Trypanosoma vivax (strain Y486) TaxID=1055687 RepID=G0U0F6_TRYVY|nr:hypothetical protein TRVL_04589 [Trypanosoma vivax]KAH8610925.1 hypothetical protein ERJ75_001056200 [Trypanosoma vivax]CCC49554.1 conserved hypothetical protein [Trypanosoma vivax Y486]
MTCGTLVLLRDSCSAIYLLEEVRKQTLCAESNCSNSVCESLADYVLCALTPQSIISLSEAQMNDFGEAEEGGEAVLVDRAQLYTHTCPNGSTLQMQVLYIGNSPILGVKCFVALPLSSGRVLHDLCGAWARYAHFEQARQCAAGFRLAMLQTIGGGWASLKQAERAMECALKLHTTATSINDTATQRKCRAFVGWAHLWSGDVKRAVDIFKREKEVARIERDDVHERRCTSALHHAAYMANKLRGEAKQGWSSPLPVSWVDIFTDASA